MLGGKEGDEGEWNWTGKCGDRGEVVEPRKGEARCLLLAHLNIVMTRWIDRRVCVSCTDSTGPSYASVPLPTPSFVRTLSPFHLTYPSVPVEQDRRNQLDSLLILRSFFHYCHNSIFPRLDSPVFPLRLRVPPWARNSPRHASSCAKTAWREQTRMAF